MNSEGNFLTYNIDELFENYPVTRLQFDPPSNNTPSNQDFGMSVLDFSVNPDLFVIIPCSNDEIIRNEYSMEVRLVETGMDGIDIRNYWLSKRNEVNGEFVHHQVTLSDLESITLVDDKTVVSSEIMKISEKTVKTREALFYTYRKIEFFLNTSESYSKLISNDTIYSVNFHLEAKKYLYFFEFSEYLEWELFDDLNFLASLNFLVFSKNFGGLKMKLEYDGHKFGLSRIMYFPEYYDSKSENLEFEEFEFDKIIVLSDPHITTKRNLYYESWERLTDLEEVKKRSKIFLDRLDYVASKAKAEDNKKSKMLFIFTGDITDRGSELEFLFFHYLISKSDFVEHHHMIIIPGNHDIYSFSGISGVLESRKQNFFEHFYGVSEKIGKQSFVKNFEISRYNLVILETGCFGETGSRGEFSSHCELETIFRRNEISGKKTIVFMHHTLHDFLRGGEELKDLFLKYEDSIEYLVCGHQHGEISSREIIGRNLEVFILDTLFRDLDVDVMNSTSVFVV